MKYKEKITVAFNKGSKRYDELADVQNIASSFLLKQLTKIFPEKQTKNIIELGSGTGIFTKMVKDYFIFNKFDAIEISADMIRVTKKKISDKKLFYLNEDFDSFEDFNKYNLILSNMSLHWSSDINKITDKIVDKMPKKSVFCFTVPNDESFSEVENFFHLREIKSTLNKLPSHKFIEKNFLNKKLKINTSVKKITKKYKNLINFFIELKEMGVNTSKNNHRSKLFTLRSFNSPVEISYMISCFCIKK